MWISVIWVMFELVYLDHYTWSFVIYEVKEVVLHIYKFSFAIIYHNVLISGIHNKTQSSILEVDFHKN